MAVLSLDSAGFSLRQRNKMVGKPDTKCSIAMRFMMDCQHGAADILDPFSRIFFVVEKRPASNHRRRPLFGYSVFSHRYSSSPCKTVKRLIPLGKDKI